MWRAEQSGGTIRGEDSLNELKTAESRGLRNFQEVIHVYEARSRAFTGRLRQTFERGDEPWPIEIIANAFDHEFESFNLRNVSIPLNCNFVLLIDFSN